ncbi:hypothetical protein BT63DRAFT_428749 [Microthyrium microscopicum]|uniref:Uncharacterized protein n=1 Tax=Microthyrium microscopicum TaxID=703497 RepID=A0A6A6U124_9PEZI|nr:hypothetical protein BT63DRAFT_428749 [Microthyrium microscopicum]
MRNVTPPPPVMATTPPAPRWGTKEDSWMPYTPRRSSRVAAQSRTQDTSARPSSSQTFSPPSSPTSPTKKALNSPKLAKKPSATPRSRKPRQALFYLTDSDREEAPSHNAAPLPTPSKTPRKRPAPKDPPSSASRLLFNKILPNVDDAMPTPRKSRKSKAYSLTPFADVEDAQEKIEVYEDSRERIPTVEKGEDNPFLSKPSGKSKQTSSKKARKTEREIEVDKAVRNDEGLIYVFRGKKIFRRFDDSEAHDDDDNLSDLDIRRRAGQSPTPRMTRSSIKPRILFPTEEQRKAREAAAAEEADEEALTDIEVPSPTAKKAIPAIQVSGASPHEQVESGVNDDEDMDPQAESSSFENHTEHANVNGGEVTPSGPVQEPIRNQHLERPGKISRPSSPFDKWSRVKAPEKSPSETKSSKRQASPIEQPPTKRLRSGGSSS